MSRLWLPSRNSLRSRGGPSVAIVADPSGVLPFRLVQSQEWGRTYSTYTGTRPTFIQSPEGYPAAQFTADGAQTMFRGDTSGADDRKYTNLSLFCYVKSDETVGIAGSIFGQALGNGGPGIGGVWLGTHLSIYAGTAGPSWLNFDMRRGSETNFHGKWVSLGLTITDAGSGEVRVYRDGTLQQSYAASRFREPWLGSGLWGAGYGSMAVGCDIDWGLAWCARAALVCAYRWQRVLTDAEMLELHRDPYLPIRPRPRIIGMPGITTQSLEGDVTEGGLLGETLVGQVICSKSITEGGVLGDGRGVYATVIGPISEGGILGETKSVILDARGFAVEGLLGGDTESARLTAPLSIEEGSLVGDTETGNLQTTASTTDGILGGDSESVAATFTQGTTEGLLAGDTYSSLMAAVASIVEGLLAGDTTTSAMSAIVSISEGGVLGDATDSLIAIGVSLSEGLILGDSRSSQAAYQASLTEGGILGDTRTVTGSLLFSITEGAVAGDNVSGAAQKYASLTEGGLLGDSSPAVTLLAACFIVERGTVGDSSAVSAQMRNSIVEGGILGDSKTVVVSFSVAINEESIAGDTEAVMRTVYASLSEGGITGDSTNSIAAFASSIVEGVLAGETENAVTTYVVYVSESGLLGEELEVIKRTFSRSYNIPLPHEPIKVADLIKQVKATKIMPSSAKAADKIIIVKPIKLSDAPPPTKKSAAPPPERKRSTEDND